MAATPFIQKTPMPGLRLSAGITLTMLSIVVLLPIGALLLQGASYPGADAQTVENSVTKVIEQGMTGVDNLQYMSATSTSSGSATITLTFTSAANPDDVARFPKLDLVTIADFGGWKKAQPEHFGEGGIFDQIYTAK